MSVDRLAAEAEQLALRRCYVSLKIDYWRAIEARTLANGLKRPTAKK